MNVEIELTWELEASSVLYPMADNTNYLVIGYESNNSTTIDWKRIYLALEHNIESIIKVQYSGIRNQYYISKYRYNIIDTITYVSPGGYYFWKTNWSIWRQKRKDIFLTQSGSINTINW